MLGTNIPAVALKDDTVRVRVALCDDISEEEGLVTSAVEADDLKLRLPNENQDSENLLAEVDKVDWMYHVEDSTEHVLILSILCHWRCRVAVQARGMPYLVSSAEKEPSSEVSTLRTGLGASPLFVDLLPLSPSF